MRLDFRILCNKKKISTQKITIPSAHSFLSNHAVSITSAAGPMPSVQGPAWVPHPGSSARSSEEEQMTLRARPKMRCGMEGGNGWKDTGCIINKIDPCQAAKGKEGLHQ